MNEELKTILKVRQALDESARRCAVPVQDRLNLAIANAMASEPDLPQWVEFANGVIPAELGKLLTGRDYAGDAGKCMDAVAANVDAQLK